MATSACAPALQLLDGVRVVAIADPTEASRQKVQALLGLPDSACFADYRQLLEAGVDYVTLTVPQKFRRRILEDCARAGVHVLSEKPMATVPADAQAMIETMREAKLRYGIVHNYLYYPEYSLARQLVTSGAIGTLRHVTLNFLGMPDNPGAAAYRPQWRHDPGEAGLRSLEAVLAAYASGATGRAVLLPLSPNDPVYRRGVAGLKELPVWVDSPLRRRGVFGL